MRAAHHLGDDLDLGIVQNNVEIVDDFICERTFWEVAQVKNVFYVYFFAQTLFDYGGVFSKDFGDAASDGTESEKCNVDHKNHLKNFNNSVIIPHFFAKCN